MPDPFREKLERKKEGRHLEYKESHPWEGGFRGKLIKEILGMANTRDGGTIIIGVSETDDGFVPDGMEPNHLDTYDEDQIKDKVATRADPFVQFTLSKHKIEGNTFLSVDVEEFEEIPVICRKSFCDILEEPKLYIRSRRKPETIEVPSQTEMRELLQMAIDKGIRQYRIREAQRTAEATESDKNKFDQEIQDLL